jgi:hypothetical protein
VAQQRPNYLAPSAMFSVLHLVLLFWAKGRKFCD